MSSFSFLSSWLAYFIARPTLTIVISISIATCIVLGVVLYGNRKLTRRIREVTENRFFAIALKTYYIGYDANHDTLQITFLATRKRKRVDVGVLKFFSKSGSFGKEFVISGLRAQLLNSVVQFSDPEELEDIIAEVEKWCDKIVRVQVRPSDLPRELDRRI